MYIKKIRTNKSILDKSILKISSLNNNKLVNKIIAILKLIKEFPKIKLIGIRKKAIFSKKSFTLLLLKIIKRY